MPYGRPTDISPDITITFNNAGHIMGSATITSNISGTHNILYSGDYKYAKTQLLDGAMSNYPRWRPLLPKALMEILAQILCQTNPLYIRLY